MQKILSDAIVETEVVLINQDNPIGSFFFTRPNGGTGKTRISQINL